MLHVTENVAGFHEIIETGLRGKPGFTGELIMVRKSGERFPALFSSYPVWDAEGNMTATLTMSIDITERKQAEKAQMVALQEKEILLREIHHRVKNNMQVISSLLTLQAEVVKNEQVLQALLDSQQRIIAMAMIHETLYSGQSLAAIELSNYINSLVQHLKMAYSSQAEVKISLEPDKIELDIDQAVPCGLIINELVTNAFKHAFPEGITGTIRIEVHRIDETEMVLIISDNGVGLLPDLEISNTSSLGMRLVQGLLEHQLKGSLDVSIESGTVFTLRWPMLSSAKD
jgi:two-component sensor histidine kinase